MKKKTNSNYFFKGKVKAIFSRFQEKRPILLIVVWPNASFLAKSRETISKSVQTLGFSSEFLDLCIVFAQVFIIFAASNNKKYGKEPFK